VGDCHKNVKIGCSNAEIMKTKCTKAHFCCDTFELMFGLDNFEYILMQEGESDHSEFCHHISFS
jgi:hypothetical protein